MDVQREEILELIHNSKRPFVLVNFFASWCRPCRRELPELVEMQKDSTSDVEVILISVDKPNDAKSKLKNFLNEFGVGFQTYARSEQEAELIKDFYLYWDGSIPLTLLYNNKGKQLEVFKGMTDRQEIELLVNKYRMLGGSS